MPQNLDSAASRARAASRRPFIDAVEIWTPDGDDGPLRLAGGAPGDLSSLAAAGAEARFPKGEDLVGRAWEAGSPILLKRFEESEFKRAAAAEGLGAALALPVFDGARLKAVVVFFCIADETRNGAMEIWRGGGSGGPALRLHDGYFGGARNFYRVARTVDFPRGKGLPGGVWASGAPMLLRDLGSGYRFIRAESAGAAGLTTGMGLPSPSPAESGAVHVVTLLSARSAPIGRRFEIWTVESAGEGRSDLILVDGICEREGALLKREPLRVAAVSGPIGRVVETGLPFAAAGADAQGSPAGYGAVVAIPVHRGGALAHVAAWYV